MRKRPSPRSKRIEVIQYKPQVIAHRGDLTHAPENTLAAFASAIAKGVDGVELDVHPTADGELIVHHFYGLGFTNNGAGLVSETTLRDLKQLDAGSWFAPKFAGETLPTLAEVFDLCKGKCRLEVDMKGSSLKFLQRVIQEVERFDWVDDVELTTDHHALLVHAKRINPRLRTGTFFYQPPDWMPLRLAQQHAFDKAKDLTKNNLFVSKAGLLGNVEKQGQNRIRVPQTNNLLFAKP